MTTAELIKIAKVIYAEGGIFSGKNYNALLAIAQCIHDLLPSYKDLDNCLASAFTTPSDQYDPQCLQAAQAVFEQGERRFQDAESLLICSELMTIWAVIPYQISGDTFILAKRRRKRR